MKINGSQLTIKILESFDIDIVFGIPGGANLPLYDALSKSSIKHILARHEQGAGFMAQGLARIRKKPAVCFATSGPGATNLITAIADAKMDSIPMIAITGQIPSSLIGTDAFQEVDTYGITIPITNHNFLVKSARELLNVIPEAFKAASGPRPGPVVIDIPKDVQKEEIEISEEDIKEYSSFIISFEKHQDIQEDNLKQIAQAINESKRPLIIAGGGIISSDSSVELKQFSHKNTIPVATTLMSLGSFDTNNSLYLGMPGMHGSMFTNNCLEKADLIIALGARFDDRVTGKSDEFCKNAKIIHIDIDKSEFNKIKKAEFSMKTDLKIFFNKIIDQIEENNRSEWTKNISDLRKQYPDSVKDEPFSPYSILSCFNELADKDSIITTDVGQHQMWTAQYFKFDKPGRFLTSGGLGTMGFGLPAAIGAAFAMPDKQILCFSGDGSFLMNLQELAVMKEHNLNIKVIIFNNESLGLVRQQQELFFDENYFSCDFNFTPDFAMLANSFGIKGFNLKNSKNLNSDIEKILLINGPALVDIPIQKHENVFPIVPPGKSNTEMIGGLHE